MQLDRRVRKTERKEHESNSCAARGELTKREKQVLRAMATGAGAKEVAQQLRISIRTVHFHLSGAYRCLKATSLLHALYAANIIKLCDAESL